MLELARRAGATVSMVEPVAGVIIIEGVRLGLGHTATNLTITAAGTGRTESMHSLHVP